MTNSSISLTDELERLAALHKSGVLTDDEFKAQKARVLDPPPFAAPPTPKPRSMFKRAAKWTGIAVVAFLVFAFVNAEYPELFLSGLPACDTAAARKMVERTVEENSVGFAQGRRIIRWIADSSPGSTTADLVRCRARVALNAGGETDMAYTFDKKGDEIFINVEFD